MEHAQTVTGTGTQLTFFIKNFDEQAGSKSCNHILNRRLKNRERQRRYRARKRLLTDVKKASILNQSPTAHVLVEQEGNPNNYMTHVHSRRNWKRDARRAHACKGLDQTFITAGISASALKLESQVLSVYAGITTEQPPDMNFHSDSSLRLLNYETQKSKRGRRDWKAEARNKKN